MAKETISQEKGLARIQELMEMFPEMPRLQVIRADYAREGLRRTPTLDEVGRWAMPDAHDHYVYDYEQHQEGDRPGGVSRTPAKMYFGKAEGITVALDSSSPYEVRYEGGGRYWLYRDGDPIQQVYFLACPQWFWKKTSSGRPMNLIGSQHNERHFGVTVSSFCEYFKEGNQCLYCNMNTTADHFVQLGRQRAPMNRGQDVYETYLAYAQESEVEGIGLIGGSMFNRSKEADLYLRNIEVLKRAMRDCGHQVERIHVVCQAMEEEDSLRFKAAGVTNVFHNTEVWDPRLFEIICPGKAKHTGREHHIECLLKDVEIFGWGEVHTNFVTGVEMAPPFGFKTEDEAAQSLLEGMQFFTSHGVSMVNTTFVPRQWAVLAQAPRPRAEYLLRMVRERDKLHKEYILPNFNRL